MTPEIKQHIQQIRQGKTPKGYKKTKIGIIPSEWEERLLGEIATITIGEFVIKTKQNPKSPYPVYNGGISYTGFYDDYNNEGGKIVISARGANAGFVNFVKRRYWAGNSCYSVSVMDTLQYNINFIYLLVKYKQSKFIDNQQAANIPSVSKKDVEHFEIEVPPLPEQTAIAEILSTQDRVIELKEQLLAEKKRQKKYLMQQLLTGKKRLKGFKGEWKRCKLGEIGSLKNGMNFSKDAMNKGYPFVNLMNIFGRSVVDYDNLGKAEASIQQLKEYNLIEGDVLFVRSSVKLEGVGEAALVTKTLENTTFSGFLIRFRDEIGLSKDFKRYVFSSDLVRKQIMSQATDSANKNINQSVLSGLELSLPPLPEQTAIAEILSTADREIELLQQSIEAEKLKKKSLMQLLLTGIVRVGGVL